MRLVEVDRVPRSVDERDLAVGNPFVESSPDLDELRVGLANDDERGYFDRAQITPQRRLDPGATGAQTPCE